MYLFGDYDRALCLYLNLSCSSIFADIHVIEMSVFFFFKTPHREAMRRGTSIFLPTATYPMFPERLAMERMSLQQGKLCRAVSISVTLQPDGR